MTQESTNPVVNFFKLVYRYTLYPIFSALSWCENQLTILGDKVYVLYAKAFGFYGYSLGNPVFRYSMITFGLVFAFVFLSKYNEVEYYTDLDDLYIEKGTRVIEEMNFYYKWFGGFSRAEVIAMNNDDGSPITTKKNLDAMLAVAGPLLTTETSTTTINGQEYTFEPSDVCDRPPPPPIFTATPEMNNYSYTNLTFWWTPNLIDRKNPTRAFTKTNYAGGMVYLVNCANDRLKADIAKLFTLTDSCAQMRLVAEGSIAGPVVFGSSDNNCQDTDDGGLYCCANYYRPYIQKDGVTVYAVDATTRETTAAFHGSGSAFNAPLMTEMMHQYMTANLTAMYEKSKEMNGLPTGWGIDQFPCSRASPLDCFEEGSFDYPANLALLQPYSPGIIGNAFLDNLQFEKGNYSEEIGGDSFAQAETEWRFCSVKMRNLMTSAYYFDKEYKGASWYNKTLANDTNFHYNPDNADDLVYGIMGESLVHLFSVMGYWWRQSYSELASDDEIGTHMYNGVANTVTGDITPTDCSVSGFFYKLGQITGLEFDASNYTWTDGDSKVTRIQDVKGQCCLAWVGLRLPDQLYVGGYPDSLTVFRTVFTMPNPQNPFYKQSLCTESGICDASDKERLDIPLNVEQMWIDTLTPMWQKDSGSEFAKGEKYSGIGVFFYLDRSVNDMLTRATNMDAILVISGYLVIFVYSMLVFTKFPYTRSEHWIYSRATMGVIGCGICVLSSFASFGVFGWVKVKQSPLSVTLVPFLSVGLATDDMFVFLGAITQHIKFEHDARARMTEIMADSGTAVTVASVSNIAAFLIGSLVQLPVIQLFCWQMCFALFCNWILLHTMFIPLMYFTLQNAARKKMFCVTTTVSESSLIFSPCRDLFLKYGARHVIKLWVKLSILVIQAVLIGVAIWLGFYELKEGLNLRDVATHGTYVRDYLGIQFKYFNTYSIAMVTRDIDNYQYFQENVIQFVHDTQENEYLSPILPLENSCAWYSIKELYKDSIGYPLGDQTWRRAVAVYFSTTGATSLTNFICTNITTGDFVPCNRFDEEDVVMNATSCSAFTNNLFGQEDFVASIKSLRKAADASFGNKYCPIGLISNEDAKHKFDEIPCGEFECDFRGCTVNYDQYTLNTDLLVPYSNKLPHIYFFGFTFQYWEQYLHLENNLYQVLGLSILGVFVATMSMQFSPRNAILAGVFLLVNVVQLYGFMVLAGVKRNAFSVVNLVVSVGAAVQFTAHVCHTFLLTEGTKNERMVESIAEMLGPLLHGSLTSFISIVALAFSRFPFFLVYYFAMTSIMILFSLWNGIVIVPILLSFIGPPSVESLKKTSVMKATEPATHKTEELGL